MSEAMSWYSGKDLNEAIHRYHDNHTRQSLQQYQQARLVCVQLVQVIANYLSSQTPQLIVHRLLPVEDVADENDRLQFCVHFVVQPESDAAVEEDVAYLNHCKATLRVSSESTSQLGAVFARMLSHSRCDVVGGLCCSTQRCVDSVRAAAVVHDLLQLSVQQTAGWRGKVRMVVEGSAVRAEVYPDVGWLLWGRLACSVLFVPGVEVRGHTYVSRSADGCQSTSSRQWIRSFASDEQMKLHTLDAADDGCRKMLMRTLIILRSRLPALAGLNAYCLKTALFREMDDETLQWSQRDVGCRLMGVLRQLDRARATARLPHYYLPSVNLMSRLSWADTSELGPFGYVRCLINSKTEMMNALQQ